MKAPLALSCAAGLVVIPTLLLALWQSGQQLTSTRDINRSLVESSMLSAYANWCVDRGQDLCAQIQKEEKALRQLSGDDWAVMHMKEGEICTFFCLESYLELEPQVLRSYLQRQYHFPLFGKRFRHRDYFQLYEEQVSQDELRVQEERSIAVLCQDGPAKALAVSGPLRSPELIYSLMVQAGGQSTFNARPRHSSPPTAVAGHRIPLDQKTYAHANLDNLYKPRSSDWRWPLLHIQNNAGNIQGDLTKAFAGDLAAGRFHLPLGAWYFVADAVGASTDDHAVQGAIQQNGRDWQARYQLLDASKDGLRSGSQWHLWSPEHWQFKQYRDRICVFEDTSWVAGSIDRAPFVWHYGSKRFDLSSHVEVLRRARVSTDQDRFLRIHEIPRQEQLALHFAFALHHDALAEVVTALEHSTNSWWIPLSVLMSVCLGLGLLVVTIRRERGLVRDRERFLAEASHELRTPAALIRLHAETLAMDRLQDPKQRQHYLQTIVNESQHLGDLVEKTLSGARWQAGQLSFSFTDGDLASMVRETVRGFADRYDHADRHILITACPESMPVRCDMTALRQVLVNLLDNAVKYASHGDIEVELSRQEAIALRVIDHGRGIPLALHAEAVQAFRRLEAGRERGGTGLGLHLAKVTVDAHGGRLQLAETAGGGLTVSIQLPRLGCHE